MDTAIDRISRKAARIKNGNDEIKPGQTVHLNAAATFKDCIRQGDLYLTVIDKIPDGHVHVENPQTIDCQLVPGSTQGAKHCLDSLHGIDLYRPAEWGLGYEGLIGPVLAIHETRTVQHPTHGDVVIAAGHLIQCDFQREFDQEQMRERRNAD